MEPILELEHGNGSPQRLGACRVSPLVLEHEPVEVSGLRVVELFLQRLLEVCLREIEISVAQGRQPIAARLVREAHCFMLVHRHRFVLVHPLVADNLVLLLLSSLSAKPEPALAGLSLQDDSTSPPPHHYR